MNKLTQPLMRAGLLTGVLLSLLPMLASPGWAEEESSVQEARLTFDNLVPVDDPGVALAYIDPDADFSVFRRIAVLEPAVSFRRNWRRDQNRSRTRNISTRDMDRIKRDVATFHGRQGVPVLA